MNKKCFLLFVCIIALWPAPAVAQESKKQTSESSGDSTRPPRIVVGFVGGFVRADNAIHGGVQVAEHIGKQYPQNVFVKVYENRRGQEAHDEIVRLLDTNRDGSLSDAEKRQARIVLYGHSWGASEAVSLARDLQKDGIPVLLTIQVDSVSRFGEDDVTIPSNVSRAVNFYQSNGVLVHGEPRIHAFDPVQTKILGNFRYDYSENPVRCAAYPWYARVFENPHIEIECDPAVMKQIENLINAELVPLATAGAER
jgi:hypothetical protein